MIVMGLKKKVVCIIKFLIPNVIWNYFDIKKTKQFKGLTIEKTFKLIKENNHWGDDESVSGTGSNLSQTKDVIYSLQKLIKEYRITSVLDIPCGDFNWMKEMDLEDVSYTGADIVSEIIDNNLENYQTDKVNFETLDLTADKLPEVDLVLCRDCLVHFSYRNIYKAILNLKKSNSKYLLMTSFVETSDNFNIVTGNWRKLNFLIKPFCFPKPDLIIIENCTERDDSFNDKALCLWKLSELTFPLYFKVLSRFKTE